MKSPKIPAVNFESKAVLVLEDNGQCGSYPLGFVEKCPLITVGERFVLPDGKDAGTITEVYFGAAYCNELVASFSFKTDKWPFSFMIYADAREVATYYQRSWWKRWMKLRKFTHRLEIEVSDGFRYRKRGHPREETLYPVYTIRSRYKQDSFETFLKERQKTLDEDRTLNVYGVRYKVKTYSLVQSEANESDETWTKIVLTESEVRDLLSNAKAAKKRWQKYYLDSHGRGFSGRPKQPRSTEKK